MRSLRLKEAYRLKKNLNLINISLYGLKIISFSQSVWFILNNFKKNLKTKHFYMKLCKGKNVCWLSIIMQIYFPKAYKLLSGQNSKIEFWFCPAIAKLHLEKDWKTENSTIEFWFHPAAAQLHLEVFLSQQKLWLAYHQFLKI